MISVLAVASCSKEEQPAAPVFTEVGLIQRMEPYLVQTQVANNLAAEKIAKDAGKDFLEFAAKENSLADYPLFFESGTDAGGGQSWVKFRTGFFSNETSLFSPVRNYGRVSFQLVGKMDTEKAASLKPVHAYFISGKMVRSGWDGAAGKLPFNPTYTDSKLDFGTVTYNISEIK